MLHCSLTIEYGTERAENGEYVMGSILGLCVSQDTLPTKPTDVPNDQIVIDKRDGKSGSIIGYAIVRNPQTVADYAKHGISESDILEFARGAIVIKCRAKYWPSTAVRDPIRSLLTASQRAAYDKLSDTKRDAFRSTFEKMVAEQDI